MKTEISVKFLLNAFKNFLLPPALLATKPPIGFFAQNSLQFGRRARRSGRGELDISSLVLLVGIEPTSEAPEAPTLSIELQEH